MPIYDECWWDSLIIDVILSNIPGMLVARFIITKLELEDFDWFGRHGKKSISEWEIWTNHKRLIGVGLTLFFYTMQFIGCFFLPNGLHHKAVSSVGLGRLIIWASMGYLSFKEFYIYASEGVNRKKSLVQPEYLWLPVHISVVELLICYKWADKAYFKYTSSVFPWVKVLWAIVLPIAIGWTLYLKWKSVTDKSSKKVFLEGGEDEKVIKVEKNE